MRAKSMGLHESATRRAYMVVAGYLGLQIGVLNNGFPVFSAPHPTVLSRMFWLLVAVSRLLPVATGLLAVLAAVFRRTEAASAAGRIDQIWRAAGTGAIALLTRERISGRLSPLLARIEAGESLHPSVRQEATLLEAELRDQLRAACFTGSRVPGAARRLRAAGADVILLDDSGELLTTSERERIEAAVVPVLQELAAQLEGVQGKSGGEATSSHSTNAGDPKQRVVVRVMPATRTQALVVTSQGQSVLALERAGT